MGRLAPPSRLLSGSSQLLLLLLTLGTVARVANGCQISGVQVSARSETTITVTWTEVGVDATSYVLQLTDRIILTFSSFTVYGSASTFTFTGLVPDRSYSIAITVNCIGTRYVAATVVDSTLPPKVNVTITDKTMTSMSFSWEVPSSSLSYNPRLKDNNNINKSLYVLSPGSITFTYLTPDTNYYAYVETKNYYCSQISDVVMDRTLPAKVNVSTIAKNTTTITVSWNMSSVDLVYYAASLKERQDGPDIQSQTRRTLPQNVTFTRLVPGRNYFIFVTIDIPGSHIISVTVTERTLPPKVNVTISVSSPTAMTVSWLAPISDVDYYVVYLSETYNATAVKSVILSSTIKTQAFTDLVPGRSYDASVTVYSGIDSQPSDIVTNKTLSSYIILTITSKTTTTMTVSRTTYLPDWFSYWAYLRETASGNLVTTFQIYSNAITFTGLDPGRNYSVSVQASDGSVSYWSDEVMDITYPASVRYFSCFTYSSENISCSWSLPDGVWSLLYLQVINGIQPLQIVGILNNSFTVTTIYSNETIVEPRGNGRTNLTFAMLGRLKRNTEYLVDITTFSGYVRSQTLQGKAQTEVSAPPPVLETVNITTVQNQVTPSSLTISFNCSWFQKTNGDLKYYTVIVKQSDGTSSESPEKRWPLSTYSEYASGSTNVYQVDDRVYPYVCYNPKYVTSVQIGTGGMSGSFSDGLLKQNTAYRISFRVYTYLPNARSGRAGGVAIYTDTRFSLPLMTLVGGIGSSGSIIGPVVGGVVGGVLGAFVIIVGGVLLCIRRKQLNCFKKPDSTQQTSTRKWDDLPAIPSVMKKDVCDASHKADNEYVNSDDSVYEDLDNGKRQEDHHSGAPSKTGDDAKTVDSSDPTYLAPDNAYVIVK